MGMITTIHGEMDENELEKLEGFDNMTDAVVHWVEYRLPHSNEIVHRSVYAVIKQGAMSQAIGEF